MRFSFFILSLVLIACKTPPNLPNTITIGVQRLDSNYHASIRGMSVVDSTTIWVSGADETILRTTDQGLSWKKIPVPDTDSLDFRSIHAFSSTSAIVVSAGFPAKAYKTNDGGQSWSLVYENQDSAAFMNSIAFKNEREGIIMGDQLKGRHLILRTGNAGVTWQRIDSIDVPKPLAVENGFAASGSCIAVSKTGRFFIGFGGEESRVFSSINGYKWKAKTTPLKHGEASAGIYSISASGHGKIMAVGGDYSLPDSSHFPIISINSGKSWVKTSSRVSGYRSVVDYCETGEFWAAGGTNGIDVSSDDGNQWSLISSIGINTLRFLPGTTKAIAADSNGQLYLLHFSKN